MKPPERFPPDDPREWINRARSNLIKAVKALLIARGVDFPYVHDLGLLLTLLEEAGETIPEEIRQAEKLNPYATASRYPDVADPVSEDEYDDAVRVATAVVDWAQARL